LQMLVVKTHCQSLDRVIELYAPMVKLEDTALMEAQH
jgi:hypothetical protein